MTKFNTTQFTLGLAAMCTEINTAIVVEMAANEGHTITVKQAGSAISSLKKAGKLEATEKRGFYKHAGDHTAAVADLEEAAKMVEEVIVLEVVNNHYNALPEWTAPEVTVAKEVAAAPAKATGEFQGLKGAVILELDNSQAMDHHEMATWVNAQHASIPQLFKGSYGRNKAVFINCDGKMVYLGVLKNSSKREWFETRSLHGEVHQNAEAHSEIFWRLYENGAPSANTFTRGSIAHTVDQNTVNGLIAAKDMAGLQEYLVNL